ncbi:MAG: hypothetical protein M0019_09850 [Actinomycetota bacterium]|nr:hypothetical protein [Actinomycetota bacterium]
MIINLDLRGKKIAVVGDGSDAIYRAKKMASEGAEVTIFSDVVDQTLIRASNDEANKFNITIEPANAIFARDLLRRERLSNFAMIVATDRNVEINTKLERRSRRYNILLNTLDEPATCNFSHVAVKEPIQGVEIAISTGGQSPAFASHLARKIEANIGEVDKEVFKAFVTIRQEVKRQGRSTFEVNWKEIASEVEARYHHQIAL